MKKAQQNKITGGLDSLLNPTPTAQAQPETTPAKEPKQTYNYTMVCYNIRPDLADGIRDVAYWDRKRINAVVNEAFETYLKAWRKKNPDIPKRPQD